MPPFIFAFHRRVENITDNKSNTNYIDDYNKKQKEEVVIISTSQKLHKTTTYSTYNKSMVGD